MSATSRHALTREQFDGIHVLMRDGDAARTIVFLHGIGGRADTFAGLMQSWPYGPRLVAWDAPGYGPSMPLTKPAPLAKDYATALRLLCDAMAVTKIDLVAQSLGCLVAGSFATRHPERVRRVTLLAPAQGYATKSGTLTETLAQRVADFKREGAAAFAARRAPRLVHRPTDKPDIVAAVRDVMATLTDPGHAQAVHMLSTGDLPDLLDRVVQPLLILNGREDLVTPLAQTEALHAGARRRFADRERLVVIPDAGHAVYLEAPDAVVGAITRFLGGTS